LKTSNIHFTGYLTDGEIKALMQNCRAFIHPAIYEGFGIPPLEAMSCGADLIISTATCLPEIYEKSGIPYFTEYQHSCGYARRCGLQHAKGRYYFDVDSDTLYPPKYFEIMLNHLTKPEVACASATWSYFPDENHSKLGLKIYEMTRDLFLWIQHFKRPELSVRGLVFAYNADYGRQEPYRVDIIRGEDGSMAFNLKKYGKIVFVRDRRCRAITGYGTIGNKPMYVSFFESIRTQLKGVSRIFYKTDRYVDSDDNLVK
jgi:glycosyltransferase involved in cell wall biosynthesis